MSKIHCIDFEYDHDYDLIGIHSTLPDYRMAYFLNHYLEIQLSRFKENLDFKSGNCSFPLYIFEDKTAFTTWSLIANKHVFTENVIQGGSNLFPEETKITYLIPEKKKVDYFIKISGLKDDMELNSALLGINKINNIIASYAIDPMDLKSRDNLIF
ncbi:IPExxxVDY family protein [Lutimonas zeaxanthinifaciens]|uniref:IPExxxVDY family protein n=1 Tax=Lutimonas zeaxanthinifaciens TaxID=3060215 RepID=UPI00265CE459|nr:IPExxxVDY family protein [Lutimonas sp. YSD2104]WKK65822.1 IPExxxVDY family protein [Lutimonas sp. YSD2104]